MPTTVTVVLGSPKNDPLMEAIASAIKDSGINVVVVDLDPTGQNDAVHETQYRDALADVAGRPIIGGFSLGARIAVRLSPEVAPLGLLCFGFPFENGLESLCQVQIPTRIIQGTRDPYGSETDVKRYQLPKSVEIIWVPNGNHRFVPRARSGFTHEDHIATVTASAISFIKSLHL